MFAQINDGNAIALPYAKGFGWGGELNLQYIFEKLFDGESGQGAPAPCTGAPNRLCS
jgi:ribose 5-phosphate isomerase RpiB